MTQRPLYVFDLDGTLADMTHRLPFIQQQTKDWDGFFAACPGDQPIAAALTTLTALRKGGAEIWVWTGRSDQVREETLEWLHTNHVFHPYWNPFKAPEMLMMRKAGDHRPDVQVKAEWLSLLDPPEYRRLTAVFEDRDSIVKMWRAAGIPCFQVAPGDF